MASWRGCSSSFPQPLSEKDENAALGLNKTIFTTNCQDTRGRPQLKDVIYRTSDRDKDILRHVFRWDVAPYQEVFRNGLSVNQRRNDASAYSLIDYVDTPNAKPLDSRQPSMFGFISTTISNSWCPPVVNTTEMYRYEIYAPGGIWVAVSVGQHAHNNNTNTRYDEVAFPRGIAAQYIRSVQVFKLVPHPNSKNGAKAERVNREVIINANFNPQSHPLKMLKIEDPVCDHLVGGGGRAPLRFRIHHPDTPDDTNVVPNPPQDGGDGFPGGPGGNGGGGFPGGPGGNSGGGGFPGGHGSPAVCDGGGPGGRFPGGPDGPGCGFPGGPRGPGGRFPGGCGGWGGPGGHGGPNDCSGPGGWDGPGGPGGWGGPGGCGPGGRGGWGGPGGRGGWGGPGGRGGRFQGGPDCCDDEFDGGPDCWDEGPRGPGCHSGRFGGGPGCWDDRSHGRPRMAAPPPSTYESSTRALPNEPTNPNNVSPQLVTSINEWYKDGVVKIKTYVDAAFKTSTLNSAYYFLKNVSILVDYAPRNGNIKFLQGPMYIVDMFPFLKGTPFADHLIDCAFGSHDDNQAYIFSANLCALITYSTEDGNFNSQILKGPMPISDMFTCLKGTVFEDGIGTAIEGRRDDVILFKGDQCARILYKIDEMVDLGAVGGLFPSLNGHLLETEIAAGHASHDEDEGAYVYKGDRFAYLHLGPGPDKVGHDGQIYKIGSETKAMSDLVHINRGIDLIPSDLQGPTPV